MTDDKLIQVMKKGSLLGDGQRFVQLQICSILMLLMIETGLEVLGLVSSLGPTYPFCLTERSLCSLYQDAHRPDKFLPKISLGRGQLTQLKVVQKDVGSA